MMFDAFPKIRPDLPPAYREVHKANYLRNRHGASPASALSQRIERWMHRQIAADVAGGRIKTTLEVGAGTLNHIPHEPIGGPYDIVEPFAELYETSDLLGRVNQVYPDMSDVPADRRYDRIISIATLEHVCDLPDLVARCGLHLADGGQLRVAIPSEGSPLWALGWRCTTGLEFRLRHRLDYGVLLRYEHVNTAHEIRGILDHFFEDLQFRVFGLSLALSIYQVILCAAPRIERCRQYLNTVAGPADEPAATEPVAAGV